MRLVFLGSAPFATPVLEGLLASRHQVAAIVTPPDRPRGRGRAVEPSPLSQLAALRGVKLIQPATTKDPAFVAELRTFEPDVLLVASYGEILRSEVLELAPQGALNVHGSLLPRWRGAAPVQAAILANDATTGVSIQRMVLALDEGDVLLARETPIEPLETAGELQARLALLGGEAALEALDRLESGTARFAAQDAGQATYAKKLRKSDGRVDWSRSAAFLARFVRAMNPWPGAQTTLPGDRGLVVLDARAIASSAAGPGILAEGRDSFVVGTGEGALELRAVKPAGRGAMEGAAFLRGARLEPGAALGC